MVYMELLSEFSQLVRFLEEQVRIYDHNFTRLSAARWIFCSFLDSVEIIVNKICFWKDDASYSNVRALADASSCKAANKSTI